MNEISKNHNSKRFGDLRRVDVLLHEIFHEAQDLVLQ